MFCHVKKRFNKDVHTEVSVPLFPNEENEYNKYINANFINV